MRGVDNSHIRTSLVPRVLPRFFELLVRDVEARSRPHNDDDDADDDDDDDDDDDYDVSDQSCESRLHPRAS